MRQVDIAIVGAGVAGLGLGSRLKAAGLESFAILERDEGPGGTWRANTYPGVACDVPSHLYSFSFAPNPGWTRRYPGQEEILRYLGRVADEHGLRPHIQAGTEVLGARFDGEARRWRIETSRGELEARVLVTACGQLSVPQIPAFEGLGEFRGELWHSARWNHEADLRGKRVAVIGSGATAIQAVPELAKVARRVYVMQRTPPWIIPRKDRAYTRLERWAFAHLEPVRRLHRAWIYWRLESLAAVLRRGSAAGRMFAAMARRHLERQVPNTALRQRLTPTYPIGCKRILISDDYYPALQRDNVELVTERIERFLPGGLRTADGIEREVDAVIFCTGFDSQALVAPMRVEGPDGTTLDQVWAQGPRAHLGITVAGLPNLFLLYGPNTNLGHNSIIFMIECQIAYIVRALEDMRRRGLEAVAVRPEAMEASDAELQERLAGSVWGAGCDSWYKTADGRITNNWAGPAIRYWWTTRRADPEDLAPAA
jgi:cation diffusion facilitator CzcD-associated flavoprotein CzcO